jgi:U3 small nucleolar RNA-associated protein 7
VKVQKEPKDVAQQRRDEEAAANAARKAAAFEKTEARTKMKGKNKPTRRQKKKQMNIIEDKKPSLKVKLAQEVRQRAPIRIHACMDAWMHACKPGASRTGTWHP